MANLGGSVVMVDSPDAVATPAGLVDPLNWGRAFVGINAKDCARGTRFAILSSVK